MVDKIIDDLDRHVDNLRDLETWLGQIYYNEEFVTFATRPVLSILSSAVKHLIDNLRVLRKRHIEG